MSDKDLHNDPAQIGYTLGLEAAERKALHDRTHIGGLSPDLAESRSFVAATNQIFKMNAPLPPEKPARRNPDSFLNDSVAAKTDSGYQSLAEKATGAAPNKS